MSQGFRTRAGNTMLVTLVVVALVALAITLEMRRQQAQKQLEQLTVRLEQLQGNNQQNEETARRIVERVRRHILIPDGVEPTVATIVNVEDLRSRNPFYNKAENGDHLIVTADRAILYDPDEDIILDIVPVQLQPVEEAPAGAVTEGQ